MKNNRVAYSEPLAHGRIKPSADEWHMVVGMAVGINRDLQEDADLKARAPEALKAFSLAVNMLATPYLKMQKDIQNAGAGQQGQLSALFNNGLPKIGLMAMLLADVVEDIKPLFSESDRSRLTSLGGFLNGMAVREASGVGRTEKCTEVLRYARKLNCG